MKLGKKSTYLLLPAFILIWGFLGHRIYNTFFSKEQLAMPTNYANVNEQKVTEVERYKLSLDYPDPFIRSPRPVKMVITPKVEEVDKSISKAKVKPSIVFLGFISSKDNNQKQAVLNYNGTVFILSNGDTFGAFKVNHISSDTLVVDDGDMQWKYGLKP